jgi:hypothetical protein
MYFDREIIVLFVLITVIIYTMPLFLVRLIRSPIGKLVLLFATILVTLKNRVGGLLVALLFIFLLEFNYEKNSGIIYEGFAHGMTSNGDGDSKTDSDKDTSTSFRAKHCKKSKLIDENGELIDTNNIASVFPKLIFKDNKTCNPCDETCEFSISDGKEQIYIQELIKPKSASQ